MPSLSSVRRTGRWDRSTRRMISSFSDGDFAEALAGHPEVTKYLTTAEVKSLLRPKGYVGTAATQVRAARVAAGRRRKRLKKRFAGTLGNIPGFD